jgi:hypothetical protein
MEGAGIKEEELIQSYETLTEFEKLISFEEGRYYVPLLWNQKKCLLPTNYKLARVRLWSTLKNLHKKPEVLKTYHETIIQQLEAGVIERINPTENINGKLHYLAHQPVVRQQKTHTKVRVVYDGSAKDKKLELPSLND